MKSKIIVRILLLIIITGSIAFLYFNQNGITKYLKVKKELKKIEEDIQKNEEEIFRLQNEIDSLKTSKEKLEKVAREKFHMSKKNEKVFIIEEK